MKILSAMIRRLPPAGFALLFLTSPSAAQVSPRPSIERNSDAMCLKADVDGDSYRPNVCDPRCDFLAADIATLDASFTCKEPAPGDYLVRVEALKDLICYGRCSIHTSTICSSDSQCNPVTNTCEALFGLCRYSSDACSSDSDCPPVENYCASEGFTNGSDASCVQGDTPCGTDADCPSGYTCSFSGSYGGFPVNFCEADRSACHPASGRLAAVTICDSVPEPSILQILGVSHDDAFVPTAASVIRLDETMVPVNHRDAEVCLAQIEATTGEMCSPGF